MVDIEEAANSVTREPKVDYVPLPLWTVIADALSLDCCRQQGHQDQHENQRQPEQSIAALEEEAVVGISGMGLAYIGYLLGVFVTWVCIVLS